LDPRSGRRHPARPVPTLVVSLLFLLVGTAAARAESARPFSVGLHAGVRLFEEDLDLEDDVAFGLRAGLGACERFTVLLDFVQSSPARITTGAQASVSALRGLTQTRLLLGTVQPYLLAGLGGVLFNFDDTSDTAVGAVTFGGGIEMRLGTRASLYGEGSADLYRARSVSYSPEGEVLSSTERDTQTAWTVLTGFQVEF
jgi:opacity protein-like surface antigen